MRIDFSKFVESLSLALDYAEKELLNVNPYHGTRIAVITDAMARYLGIDEDTVYALNQAALLHDCALSEYFNDEYNSNKSKEIDMSSHCLAGEKILNKLPGYSRVKTSVLFHHDRADGKGAFRLTADKTPLTAQLIHIADTIDVKFDLYSMNKDKYEQITEWIKDNEDTVFSRQCAEAFINSVDYNLLKTITSDKCKEYMNSIMPRNIVDISMDALRDLSSIFADITDYKSNFTWKHSMGIAQKAEKMGEYYKLSEDDSSRLYIAGALHDIGKLLISNDILEKPAKLTSEEYRQIQNHAMGTYTLLKDIEGMEDICSWASLHHEKLDGSGYPFAYTGDKLNKNERLMACLDIYQALIEDRPYKSGMSHKEAIDILKKMSSQGQLDDDLINDIDICFNTDNDTKHNVYKEYNGTFIAYRCPVCGYIYEGELPEDYICPRCEQPGCIFERIN